MRDSRQGVPPYATSGIVQLVFLCRCLQRGLSSFCVSVCVCQPTSTRQHYNWLDPLRFMSKILEFDWRKKWIATFQSKLLSLTTVISATSIHRLFSCRLCVCVSRNGFEVITYYTESQKFVNLLMPDQKLLCFCVFLSTMSACILEFSRTRNRQNEMHRTKNKKRKKETLWWLLRYLVWNSRIHVRNLKHIFCCWSSV